MRAFSLLDPERAYGRGEIPPGIEIDWIAQAPRRPRRAWAAVASLAGGRAYSELLYRSRALSRSLAAAAAAEKPSWIVAHSYHVGAGGARGGQPDLDRFSQSRLRDLAAHGRGAGGRRGGVVRAPPGAARPEPRGEAGGRRRRPLVRLPPRCRSPARARGARRADGRRQRRRPRALPDARAGAGGRDRLLRRRPVLAAQRRRRALDAREGLARVEARAALGARRDPRTRGARGPPRPGGRRTGPCSAKGPTRARTGPERPSPSCRCSPAGGRG